MRRTFNFETHPTDCDLAARAAGVGAKRAERPAGWGIATTRSLYAGVLAGILLIVAASTGCTSGSSSSSTAPSTPSQPEVVTIVANSGTPQSAPSNKPFGSPLTATVTTNGIITSGESVTFTAPASGASGTFANGTATETDVTDTNGVATSSILTANSTAGTFAVTAMVSGAAAPVSYSLTTIGSTAYTFYMSGEESAVSSYYALAGAIVVDSSGNVLAGEQDYNDGEEFSFSPQPSGDPITGGALTVDPTTGQGTLSLITNNLTVGVPNSDGVTSTETFGVQFVNANHALIMQFDGTATSSGSMDLQTLSGTPTGNFAFTLSGLSADFSAVAFGGVVTIGGTAVVGTYDVNDGSNGVKKNKAWGGTITAPDTYGRGTVTGLVNPNNGQLTLRYYVVGPEAIRLVGVSVSGTVSGSAFGQGTGTFSNASLGNSVFVVAGNVLDEYGAVGQFTTSNTSAATADFTGVGDESEPNDGVITTPEAMPITGTYSIASNGYGNLSIPLDVNTNQGLGNITTLGIYMTDPTLDINDPNNKSVGAAVGGALVSDLDAGLVTGFPLPGGIGMILPQTDAATAAADFNGNYAAGWQNLNTNFCGCEFDMIAQGTMASGGSLNLTGLVSDPLSSLGTPDLTSSGNTFTGAPAPDPSNPGRYSMTANPLQSVIDGTPVASPFQMVIYQASGGQLLWMDYDVTNLTTISTGVLEQQGSLAGLPATGKPAIKPRRRTGAKRR